MTVIDAAPVLGETARLGLLNARHLLLTDGWVTGKFRCETGATCASGALRIALGGTIHPSDATEISRPKGENGEAYNEALLALATVMDPSWKTTYLAGCEEDGYTPDDDDILDDAHDTVFEFNDTRVKTDAGRDEVLAKFDEAAGL